MLALLFALSIPELRDAAATALEQKEYARCAAAYEPPGREHQDAETMLYVASCLALAGKTDRAFLALDDMLDFQWSSASQLRNDPNLAALHADPRWPAVLARTDENWRALLGETNRELEALMEADQADREPPIDWNAVAERDRRRRARVDEILAARGAATSRDYCNAALVMQHGTEPESYRMAHELALCSVEIDPRRGCKGLAATALDRYLQSIGKPQIYGTQVRRVNGVWTLDPIDETAVTDAERARWNLPPLAEFKRRVAEANEREKTVTAH